MRKLLVLLLILPLLLILVAGCGPSAEQVMKDSMRTSKEDIKTVHFEIKQTMHLPRAPVQQGQLAKRNYVQEASGDYDQRTGDFTMKTNLVAGADVTMLQIGKKQYWQLAGNWYDVPPAVQISPPVTQALSMSQYLKEFKSISKLGNTRIDGQSVYHVKGVPDMAELVKQPGVTDLLKDPTGKQIRTVDELTEMKVVLDFYALTRNNYFKRSVMTVESRVPNDLIQQGFAEAGDKMTQDAEVTYSKYNEKLNLTAPTKVAPLPANTQ